MFKKILLLSWLLGNLFLPFIHLAFAADTTTRAAITDPQGILETNEKVKGMAKSADWGIQQVTLIVSLAGLITAAIACFTHRWGLMAGSLLGAFIAGAARYVIATFIG